MNYSQDDFLKLMEAVEFVGGTHLDETCAPKYVKIRERPDGTFRRAALARCKNEALFEVPYDLENPSPAGEKGLIKVCAVDDNLGSWPRFQHIYEEDDEL